MLEKVNASVTEQERWYEKGNLVGGIVDNDQRCLGGK
jgi:hypothetical protein